MPFIHSSHLLSLSNSVLHHCISVLALLTPPSSSSLGARPANHLPPPPPPHCVSSLTGPHSVIPPSLHHHGSSWEIMEALCGFFSFLPLFLWLHLVAEKQRMMGNEALDICCLGTCVLMWEDSLINVSLERFSGIACVETTSCASYLF